jgi:uncharacterized integral membrane protein (TIGR00698 family)
VEEDDRVLQSECEMSGAGEDTGAPLRRVLFIVLLIFCLTPWATPPIALALGLALGLTLGNPFARQTSKPTRYLLQTSVVLLGFGMNIHAVIAAGRTGFLFTVATIAGTLALGFAVGALMRINRRVSHLIASGTAICGGSAIAAVGPVIGATDEEMSVSLGTIFILNSAALFLFPIIGKQLAMTQTQFGVWAAIAIHDTSSVVGAAARFGSAALQIATTVKLSRALWIVPVTFGTAIAFSRGRARITVPWFILWFIVAALVRTWTPAPDALWSALTLAGRVGLTVTLFLIGAGLSRASIAKVGARPLLLGVALWIVISVVSLWAVRSILHA